MLLHRFHPLYNEDGSVSWFRAGCLLLLALCMIAYAVISAGGGDNAEPAPQAEDGSEILSSNQSSQAQGSGSRLKALFSAEDQRRSEIQKHRQAALSELENIADLFSSCGNINAGFIGCRFDFSENVLQFYDASINAADDGFSIVLKAKGSQLEDLCVEYGINSEGTVYALDKQGRRDMSCLPDHLKKRKTAALRRLTDDVQPNPAPSGARPLITSSAAARESSVPAELDKIQSI